MSGWRSWEAWCSCKWWCTWSKAWSWCTDDGVADLQWEPVDTADEKLLDDTFPFNETEGLKVRMNQQQNVLDFLQLYLTDKMLELIVIETNRFANQLFLKNPDKAANSYLKN